MDQTVKVNVNVIPKLTAKNGVEFKTDGSLYDGTTGSIKNGNNTAEPLIENSTAGYTPNYSVSGLRYDSNGNLVSGNQTATIRVSVPKGTIGASTDADGNSYYDITSNIVVAQPVTFEFVDDDSGNAVVGTPQSQEFIKGTATKTNLTVPENYQLATGQSAPTSYTLTDYSATTPVVQIHLKHQTKDVSDTDLQAKETRTLTVNYVDASTGQAMTGLTPAQLQVFYKRSATKDLVTNKVTYGNWQWDTSQGNNGYKVLSGDWTLPISWDNVVAKVPTVDGYTAFTTGDWEKKGNSTSDVPANKFVFPTYNGTLKTKPGDNSVAYTNDSPVYEGTATHTIYFAPTTQREGRLVTEHYKKLNADGTYSDADVVEKPDGSKQSYAQIKVWYQRSATGFKTNGSSDHTKWTISYSDWSWDKTAGDKDTPGFTVISGGYTSSDKQKQGQGLWGIVNYKGNSWGIGIPDIAGYTVFTASDDNQGYHSTNFAGPVWGSTSNGSAFTDHTNADWRWRNDLTTFYVANSLLNKTVTRQIRIHVPASNDVVTVEQTVKFERTARINRGTNKDGDYGDTKIVFGALTDGNNGTFVAGDNIWNHTSHEEVAHGTFAEFTQNDQADSSIVKPGYTAYINGQPVTSVEALTITPDATDSVVDVTYSATATAKLTGNGSTTYTGKPITTDNLNNSSTGLQITVTGPTANAGKLALNVGDVEFSTDGTTWTTTLPTDANTYQVRLTTQGENAIKSKYGNNNVIWTDKDGNPTITSDAKFTINPLSANSVLNNVSEGNYTKVYDGSATTSIDSTKFGATVQLNGQSVNLDLTGLTSADFQWADADGNAIADPQNVGTYYIKLTDAGLTTLQAHNKNFTLTNSGLGTYTITQAQASATLSGSGTRAYNGSAVSVDDLNNSPITLTLHYPKNGHANYSEKVDLTADDFVWNTPDGQAPVNANNEAYTLSLKSDVIKKLLENAAGKGQGDLANVTVADDAITGSASYKITPFEATATLGNASDYGKVYDATSTNTIDPTKLQFTTTVNGQTVTLNTSGLTGSDFTWYGGVPRAVGTYKIELTNRGFIKLQADNPNFALTSAGYGTYTISQAQGSATLNGSNEKIYNGQAITVAEINSNGQIVVNLTFPGSNSITSKYTLADGDYTITPNVSADSNLANAGTYKITLTAAGKANVRAKLEELSGNGQNNQANATVADDAITGDATFTINPSKNFVNVSGTQTETYNGKPIGVDYNADGTTSVTVSIANDAGNTGSVSGMTDVHLVSGDFQIVDASGNPTTAINAGGVYHIVLTADGVTKVQNAVGKNYKITQGDSYGTLVIKKAPGTAIFGGIGTHTYTGSAASDYLNGLSISLTAPKDPTYQLVAGDVEFRPVGNSGNWTKDVPVNVGHYDVRLSQTAWNKIKQINSDNVTWMATGPTSLGTYTINAATANTELSGHNSMVYNGNAVTTDDLYTSGSTINVAISGSNIANLPTTYKLTDGDYTWNTSDGQAPKNVGDYTITLTDTGLSKIQAAIDHAVGAGNVVLSKEKSGSATFQVAQSVASGVQLDGILDKIYDGNAADFDPSNADTKAKYHFNNVQGLNIPNFTASDFDWYDANNNKLGAAPTNVGNYHLQLNANGKKAFAYANTNYTFTDKNGKSTIGGQISYEIKAATLQIGVSGNASSVYNGQFAKITQAQLDRGDIKLVWGNSNNEPVGLGKFNLTPDDLEVVDANGQKVDHANAQGNVTTGNPVYYVRLTDTALTKIKALAGANNYDINVKNDQGQYFNQGTFLIYAHKAQVTLTGGQETTYGVYLPLDPNAYGIALTNWSGDAPVPTNDQIIAAIKGLKPGDFYVEGHADGSLPTNVGSYKVVISDQLLNKLKNAFPDYHWEAVGDSENGLARSGGSGSNIVDAEHDQAHYVITPAVTTVTINGAQHIKYGEGNTIKYGDGGYSITITAPVKSNTDTEINPAERIYTTINLTDGDLEFVQTPGDVGTYQVKLSKHGLDKLSGLTGAKNYDWAPASSARADFIVEQMGVTITVGGDTRSVIYGSPQWLDAIKKDAQGNIYPHGYTLTVKTDDGTNSKTLTYNVQDGDLIFSQTPGNVGSYEVKLSDQGLINIKNALGTNYAYPQNASDVTTYGTFNVKKGTATVTLSNVDGGDSKTYDGKATTPTDLDPTKYSYTATIYAPDGSTTQTITLTRDDLQFVDADGNAITPTNAGTYQVALSPDGKTRLKSLTGNNGENYSWTFDTKATYTINEATNASAALSGSNEKVFDGSGVTTAQINNGGNIEVKFIYPGSTDSSTYQLQDGDYDWYSEDGSTKLTSAPSQRGTYTIKLTSNGLANLQTAIDNAIGSGNVTLNADKLSGSAKFEITAKPISNVTISGNDQSKTYDGQSAGLDLSGLNISGTETVTGTPLSDTGIKASDFDWYDNGTKLDSAPTKVGTYEARLTDRALAALQDANPNYSFNEVNSRLKYTINPKAATDTLGNSGSKIYNGQGTSISNVVNSVTWTPSGLVTGESLDLSSLTDDDYEWMTKNADGTYTAMTGLPTNVGTYYLKLKDSGINKIKNANTNYSFADGAISGMYTYIITAATGSATLGGSASKTYDGHSVTTAEVNSTDGNIQVTFTFPGSTGNTYQLQDGEYSWYDASGNNLDSAPTKAGTYTIKINPAKLQSIIDSLAGKGNVTISGDTGSATFAVKKKNLTVTLGDKTGVNAGKTYDGQAGVIDPDNGNFTATGLITGDSLKTTDIPASDYQWVDENGNPLTIVPTDAGTYYIALNANGLKKLQDNNPNYNITESGKFKYVISPAEANVTIEGQGEDTKAEITTANSNFNIPGVTGITIPEGLTYQIVGNPTESGVYDVELTPESLQTLKDANKNYKLNITSTAKFTLDATLTITFEDTTEGNKQVGEVTTKTGANGKSIDLNLTVPENYELASGQTLPTSYTFGKQLNQTLNIKLVHKTTTVDPTKTNTNPDPTNINWFKQNDLTKDVTRTIIYKGLTSDQLAQIPDSEKQQTVHFTRTALYDLVTGKLVPNSEGTWTAVDGKNTWAGFTPHEFTNYTADKTVPEVMVTGDHEDSTIIITYTYTPDTPFDPGHNTDPGDHNKPGDNGHPTNPDDKPGKPGDHDHNKPGNKDHDHGNKPTKPGDHEQKPGQPNKKPAKPNNHSTGKKNGQGTANKPGRKAAQRERAASLAKAARARGKLQHSAQLPQTGDANPSGLGMVLLVMANILALLGVRPRKKH